MKKTAYMDGIDWQHHVESDAFGVKVYPSVKALRDGSEHALDECGIVEVTMTLNKWVEPQNLGFKGT